MKKILGIHGRFSVVEKSQWWKSRKADFESRWISIDIPQFDPSEDPSYESWETVLKTIDFSKYDTILSSSHGWAVIVKYLKEKNIKIPRLVCVCPGRWNTPRKNTWKFYDSFEQSDMNLKNLVDEIIVIHSRDDEMVDFEKWEAFSKQIWAKFISTNGFGHKFKWDGVQFVNDFVIGISYQKSAGAIIQNNKEQYLILRKKKTWLWGFTWWKVEQWETYLECATRELYEEASIRWIELELFSCTTTFHNNTHWLEQTYIWQIDDNIKPIITETEVFSEYKFVWIEEFPPLEEFEWYAHCKVRQLKWEEPRKLTHN